MAANYHWISYDARDDGRRRRRKWPWWILLVLLLLLLMTAITCGSWYGYAVATSDPIQTVLPDLLVDDAMTIYVVDDSGSMVFKKDSLHEALRQLVDKPVQNSQVALLMFGSSYRLLFDFTDPADAPWDTAIPSFQADSGGTNMYAALRKAHQMMPDSPICGETACRQNRIVLMSDGVAGDSELAAATVATLERSGVIVDTVSFGIFFINTGTLQDISERTGGIYKKSR